MTKNVCVLYMIYINVTDLCETRHSMDFFHVQFVTRKNCNCQVIVIYVIVAVAQNKLQLRNQIHNLYLLIF